MLAQISKKERWAYTAIASLVLFGLSYVGARKGRPTPQITLKELPVSQPSPSPLATPPAEEPPLVVDVEGAVFRPGVYRFAKGARVLDSLKAAGGATEDADTTQLNLAEPLKDGRKVDVPVIGAPHSAPSAPLIAPNRSGAGKEMPPPGSIDLNGASAEELQKIPGIGASTAAKIIELRAERGRIGSVDELRAIRGLNGKRLDDIRPVFHL